MKVVAENEGIFSGIYTLHWEVSHLHLETGKKRLGLFPISENWLVNFPKGFIWPDDNNKPKNLISIKKVCQYYLKAKGIPSAKGQFAHKGFCSRQFSISEVIELKQITP